MFLFHQKAVSFPLLFFVLLVSFSLRGAETKFELRDGDRVALIGGTFIEREQEEAFIETMFTVAFIDRNITFRNFGWSGDTVASPFDPTIPSRPNYVPKLFDYLDQFKPSVIIVSYGMMESFDGEAGLVSFTKNFNALLDRLSLYTKQIVIVSPFKHEKLGGLWPDEIEHNKNLQLYIDALQKLANERAVFFVNLFEGLDVAPKSKTPATSNGVHLTSEGYERAAEQIQKQLDFSSEKSSPGALAELREAIKKKNRQWWYHYRPMNSEYVYPGGSRYQNELGPIKLPLYSEIQGFAKLAETEDRNIAELRKRIARGEKFAASKKEAPISRPTQRDPHAPDPELEHKSFTVADGFEVNLFAADPLINKPVQIAFDVRGRLWIASTTAYPQIKPGETADDKIIILEDTDGDGLADKTTVFADHLLIPTGVLPSGDGAYVADDTKILFLRDTNGDGVADRREIVLSGFGTEDSHHKAHVFRFSPGGDIYWNQGVFLHTTFETAHGIVRHAGAWNPAGIFEYHPASGNLAIYLANSIPANPWGHYWNRWGFDFHIDSSGQGGSFFILPTANNTSVAIAVAGGEGKLAGAEIVSGRHLPDDWQGNLISSPFKENRVARWAFTDDSSGYSLKPMPPLIVSSDNAFRPVESRMGPDGAIYIADWYNPLIGHMQYHFRDPGRDFTHGRIWRVTAKNRPLVPRPKLTGVPIKQILEHLKDPEDYTRFQARRALTERNQKEVLPALAAWVKSLKPEEPEFEHHLLEALWVYQSMNVVKPELLKSLLRTSDFNARAAATKVLRYWHEQIPDAASLLETLVIDQAPRVRLQAIIASSHVATPQARKIARRALEKPTDRYIEAALKAIGIEAQTTAPPTVAQQPLPPIKIAVPADTNAPTVLTSEQVSQFAADVRDKGRTARGEEIFHRRAMTCFQCHAINGAGGQVGPDLGAVGSGSALEYIIEAVFDPNKIIKDGFETFEVITKDDESILGIKVRGDAKQVVLKDATRDEIAIPTASIKEIIGRKTSLMPNGSISGLSLPEQLDLFRFLSELGKPGPYANNTARILRRWRVLESWPVGASKSLEQVLREEKLSWSPRYARVSGILPFDDLIALNAGKLAVVQSDFEVTTAGKIQLLINSVKGLKVWIDGASVDSKTAVILDLLRGMHNVTLQIALLERGSEPLRVELDEPPGSTGRFRIPMGR